MYPSFVSSEDTVGVRPLSTLAWIFCALLSVSIMREEHVRQLPLRHSLGIVDRAREASCCVDPDENVDCRSRACRMGSFFLTDIVAS